MDEIHRISIKARNLKCFGDRAEGFESIKPINIIVGKNNSGKTSLLDLIDFAMRPRHVPNLGHRGNRVDAFITCDLSSQLRGELEKADPNFVLNYNKQTVERVIKQKYTIMLNNSNQRQVADFDLPRSIDHNIIQNAVARSFNTIYDKLAKLRFIRLSSDRDIQPEEDPNPISPITESDFRAEGDGASRICHRLCTNDNHLYREIFERTILSELNEIYGKDGHFQRLLVVRRQAQKEDRWEIHLETADGLTVPVSRMGSGTKTVLLVLICLRVLPKVVHDQSLENILFGFEELENNLHPAIQRRLLSFLRRVAEKEKCVFFITTHSHVVIDMFSRDELAQILHVTREDGCGKVLTVSGFAHHGNVFDDLDVRASDLLQSNAVVWLEGPSDRIYFNRWIELWDDELKEGVNFQCLFTGGRLTESLSFDDPDATPATAEGSLPDADGLVDDFIKVLKINRHAVVMMDRDRDEGQELKPWVKRIVEESERMGGIAWVTAGREVENYIPMKVLSILAEKKLISMVEEPGQHETLFTKVKGPKGGDRSGTKVALARQVCEHLTFEMITGTYDLSLRLAEVCAKIREWNGLPPRQ
jgi:putative ATP-dependent endonuclease of the OLD family